MGEMKLIKREWVVESGTPNYDYLNLGTPTVLTHVDWGFARAFHTEADAKAYAERLAEDTEYVRWGRKEWT